MAVMRIFPGPSVREDVAEAVHAMELAIMDAIAAAKGAGVPQGFICAILRAHEHLQTSIMVNGNE